MTSIRRAPVVAVVALGVLAAPATAAASPPVNACKLLAAAVRDEPPWASRLTKRTFTAAGGGAWRCELTSAPPKGSVSPRFILVLYFFASPTAAIAHTNVASVAKKGPPLRGTGASEAFAKEVHQGGSTSTGVTWRKGRDWGLLSVQGPGQTGDREDAGDLLAGFVRRLPTR